MDQMDELLQAISTYFDAIYFCNVEKLDSVFHQSASLFDADDGEISVEPINSFRADVENRPAPADLPQQRSDEIISIDYLSKLSANVKLRLQAHENVFVDHLAFIRGADGWKIVAKVWHLEGQATIITEAEQMQSR